MGARKDFKERLPRWKRRQMTCGGLYQLAGIPDTLLACILRYAGRGTVNLQVAFSFCSHREAEAPEENLYL